MGFLFLFNLDWTSSSNKYITIAQTIEAKIGKKVFFISLFLFCLSSPTLGIVPSSYKLENPPCKILLSKYRLIYIVTGDSFPNIT